MALPLLPPVGPGGPLIEAHQGINSLVRSNLDNVINSIKAQYAPLTNQAEAASKLAYANLMGPQFLAKLMGNNSILANLPDSEKSAALNRLYQAGTGLGTGNAILGNMGNLNGNNVGNPQNSLSNWLVDKFKNTVSQPSSQNQMSNNDNFANQPAISAEDRNQINNLSPGESYTIPERAPQPFSRPSSFAENVANYEGVVNEGKEAGTLRAKDIKDLNDTYFNGQTKQTTLDEISKILSSPEIEQIRQVPLLGHREMQYYSKFGTPDQQNMVGRYYTLTGNLIKDSSRDFAGQFRKGEQQLLAGMKPTPSDTPDVARGKISALSQMNQMLTERARLTSEIMSKYHVNRLQAEEQADKQVNGDDIRKGINDKLYPQVTIRNKKTGEVVTVPLDEARKRGISSV